MLSIHVIGLCSVYQCNCSQFSLIGICYFGSPPLNFGITRDVFMTLTLFAFSLGGGLYCEFLMKSLAVQFLSSSMPYHVSSNLLVLSILVWCAGSCSVPTATGIHGSFLSILSDAGGAKSYPSFQLLRLYHRLQAIFTRM